MHEKQMQVGSLGIRFFKSAKVVADGTKIEPFVHVFDGGIVLRSSSSRPKSALDSCL